MDWTGLDWTGLDWTGLDWTGLDWTGLGSACRRHDYYLFYVKSTQAPEHSAPSTCERAPRHLGTCTSPLSAD
jgi:hypothetical protein